MEKHKRLPKQKPPAAGAEAAKGVKQRVDMMCCERDSTRRMFERQRFAIGFRRISEYLPGIVNVVREASRYRGAA